MGETDDRTESQGKGLFIIRNGQKIAKYELAVAGALLGTTLSPPDISNLRQNWNERRA
jgi:hypothetical protein